MDINLPNLIEKIEEVEEEEKKDAEGQVEIIFMLP